MHLTRVTAKGFRCLQAIDFSPEPGVNFIRGANAQGKTSVLEAILFAATSKSHRTNTEKDLVQHEAEAFQIRLEAQHDDRDLVLEANWWRNVKRFKINGVAQTRVSDILGRIKVVFFSPEDVGLIKGGAAQRRRFLDMELSQINPAYLNALQQYRQLVRQRNELLRQHRPDPDLLDVWDLQLAHQGRFLAEVRLNFVEELSQHAIEAYQAIAGNERLTLRYRPDIKLEEDYGAILRKHRESDLRRGMTGRGPHRDDIELAIEEYPARDFGSQGQQKSAALALKLAEVALVRARTGDWPILMLDEVLAELDAQRAHALMAAIAPEVQCLMTTTELDRRPASPAQRSSILFTIRGGALEAEKTS